MIEIFRWDGFHNGPKVFCCRYRIIYRARVNADDLDIAIVILAL